MRRAAWRLLFPTEPITFRGFAQNTLAPWLAERGWVLEWDRTQSGLAKTLLPEERAAAAVDARSADQHIALAFRKALVGGAAV